MTAFSFFGLALRRISILIAILIIWGLPSSAALAQWGTTDLPEIGQPAPSFQLPDSEGQLRRLDEFHGQWVVLYFYPKDFTSGCTIEARRFQKSLDKFRAINTQIIGISADTVDSHRDFCDSEGLKFPLLSDLDGQVSQTYGSWMGDFSLRNSFIIDPEGILQEVFPIVNPSLHSTEVYNRLRELQRA
jgi:peroxiredoxin Q/BCP